MTDLDTLIQDLAKIKKQKASDLEKYKEKFVKQIDDAIDALYSRRDKLTAILLDKDALKKYRESVWEQIGRNSFVMNLRYLISAPFIYGMIIPGFFFHVCLEIYHQVAFRLYGIPLVSRKQYFHYDRRHLPQLNWLEKFNCLYCSYFNGLMAYAREISGRTERYWCPIKSAMRRKDPHSQYKTFMEYTEKDVNTKWKKIREFK